MIKRRKSMTANQNVSNEIKLTLKNVCRDYMRKKCERENCRFIHDSKLCERYWKNVMERDIEGCKYNKNCRKNHFLTNEKLQQTTMVQHGTTNKQNRRPPRNTESWEPITRPYDMRITTSLVQQDSLKNTPESNDIILVPNLFSDYKPGEIYSLLVKEIQEISETGKIDSDDLLKLWHGSEERNIPGCHYICNDKTRWKTECPTFRMVIERMKSYFKVRAEATRLNWYKDHTQFKPLHFDAAAFNEEKAKKQNITIGLSFGQTRDIIFEHAKTRKTICIPQGDGEIYTFGNKVNCEWRHGVNPGVQDHNSGRISVIIWGMC